MDDKHQAKVADNVLSPEEYDSVTDNANVRSDGIVTGIKSAATLPSFEWRGSFFYNVQTLFYYLWQHLRPGPACALIVCIALATNTTNAPAQTDADVQKLTSTSVVSLPMYEVSDRMKKADDIFWSRLRTKLEAHSIDAPMTLERTTGELIDQWRDKNLFLSQTCGYPYTHSLMQQGVKIVGTPVYTTNDDLPPGEYRSLIIVKSGTPYKTLVDLKGKIAGVNDLDSNSGMNVFRAAVASSFSKSELQQGIFASVMTTGGHMKSVRMVGDGEIDVAAIDSVSYDLIKRDYPELAAKTRVLMETSPSPGLPIITSSRTDDATIKKIQVSIKEIVTHPPAEDSELRWALDQMKLKDFVVFDQQTYHQRIYQLENMARDKGYPTLK